MSVSTKRSFNRFAAGYAVTSAVGFGAVAFCIARLLATNDPEPFLDAIFGNWTSTILMVDLLIAAGATIVWAVTEAKRLGMNWGLWLVLMATTPFAFSLPLFLAFRERRRDLVMKASSSI
ncbi:MAG: DUF2834 domain-containing protein [Actinomycetota bacterium]